MFEQLNVYKVDESENIKNRIRGKGRNKCLVILPESDDHEANLIFLERIFAAVKLKLDEDVLLCPWRKTDRLSLTDLASDFDLRTCLLFGVPPQALGLQIHWPAWKILPLPRYSLLFCEALSIIATHPDQKKWLWNNLQQLWP